MSNNSSILRTRKRPCGHSSIQQSQPVRFTKTEQRILALLRTGQPCSRQKMQECLWDNLSSKHAMQVRLSLLRQKLMALGQDVVCLIGDNRSVFYQMVTVSTPSIS